MGHASIFDLAANIKILNFFQNSIKSLLVFVWVKNGTLLLEDVPNDPKMDPSKYPKNGQKASVSGDFLGSDGSPKMGPKITHTKSENICMIHQESIYIYIFI